MRLRHPLVILALLAAPFILYSFWRAGYTIGQLFEVRVFATRYVWELAFLSLGVIACCLGFERKEKGVFALLAGAVITAFLALQAFERYSSDYKLWIYIVAPIFTWSLLFTVVFNFGFKWLRTRNA